MATMKEKALNIEGTKTKLYEEFLLKGYTPAEIGQIFRTYPKLIAGLDCKPLPKWYRDALVSRYNPLKQGVTNEQIQAGKGRFPLKDFSGNGHDMIVYNMAGEGMSGVGGYGADLSNFTQNGTGFINNLVTSKISVKFKTLVPINIYQNSLIISTIGITGDFKLNGGKYGWKIEDTSGVSWGEIKPNSSGIVKKNSDAQFIYFHPTINIEKNELVTIEQLPLYEGGLVFDGVDDYGISENQPILEDYTIVVRRKIINMNRSSTIVSKVGKGNAGPFLFEYVNDSKQEQTWSFDGLLTLSEFKEGVSYQTKNSYNNLPIKVGDVKDNSYPLKIGASFSTNGFPSFVLYDFLLFNRTLTQDELDYVKYVIMGEELPKPIAVWDAKGRRNDEPEGCRNVLLDKTGNGHNITLNNFVFEGESGYGKYEIPTFEKWTNNPDTKQDVTIAPYRMTIKSQKVANASQYTTLIEPNAKFVCELEISGIPSDAELTFANNVKLENGRNRIDYTNTAPLAVGYGFALQSNMASCDVEINLLPSSYPNALVFDGVDDYGICENMPIFTKEKGYTVIAEREYTLLKKYSSLLGKGTSASDLSGAFRWESTDGNLNNAMVSFGTATPAIREVNNITWGTSVNYNGRPITKGDKIDSNNLYLGCIVQTSAKLGFALYSLHIFDHDLTPKEIEFYIQKNIDSKYVLPKVEQVNE